MLPGGLLFTETHAAQLDHNDAYPWITASSAATGDVRSAEQSEELLGQLFTMPELPRLELPEELTVQKTTLTPKPRLRVKNHRLGRTIMESPGSVGELSFDY